MSPKKLTATVLAVAMFGMITLRPARAEALDAWAWALIGVGSYVAFLIAATAIAYPHPAPIAPGGGPLPEKESEPNQVEFGGGCRQDGPGLVVACW